MHRAPRRGWTSGAPTLPRPAAFYGALFGWNAEIGSPARGGWLRDVHAAGQDRRRPRPADEHGHAAVLGRCTSRSRTPTTTLAKATANGGTVIVGPMDVFDAGRMGVIQDPAGSFISIWQPQEHIGAELVNEPGTFTWNELAAADIAAAARLLHEGVRLGCRRGRGRRELRRSSRSTAASCAARTRRVRASSRPGPSGSRSRTATPRAAKATELGGSILMPPNDMDFGRGAVVADPTGAVFGIGVMPTEE